MGLLRGSGKPNVHQRDRKCAQPIVAHGQAPLLARAVMPKKLARVLDAMAGETIFASRGADQGRVGHCAMASGPFMINSLTRGFDHMRLDLTPYRRSTVGFDRLFDMLESNTRGASASDNYPPFNLERVADDRYRITLAVAGFTRDEIEITAQQNLLLVAGRKDEKQPQGDFLHIGIANRSFERRFELADFVLVQDARLNDGLLVIDLVREVPEAMKPKTVAIKTGAPLTAVEATPATDEAQAA